GADSFMFAKRQFLFLPMALCLMLAISLASPRHVRRMALLVFCGSVVLLAATFVIGVEIKGARRWISVPGLSSVQPSEFVKASLVGAYFVFGHVRSRFDRFLDPSSGDNYQVNTALEAFMNGSLFGRGPGEGTVKAQLPDAHTDFVMAVAGEEFGLFVCLIILVLFAFVTLRSLSRASKETSLFITLAATGLAVQFGLQAAINMASTIQLIPAKGMTLPFISYGGS